MVFVLEQIYDIFGVRRFTGTSHADIADHDNRHLKFSLLQDLPFEHEISYPYP